ncbi:MAG: tRNA (guanosine(37)-N1)-methyltransferase TrmD [Clostridiaceae bacterium]
MKIDILTLFPDMFDIFNQSIIGRAKEKNIVDINTVNIRDFTLDKHNKVDDYPYGGGAGMVLMAQPVIDSIKEIKKYNNGPVIFLGPRGKTFNQNISKELSSLENIIFLCGHYEGIDERIYEYIDMEISLGDFILTGGEMACIPIVDSILRFVPDVLSSKASYLDESFENDLLEYPQYTRPPVFDGDAVPDVLLSGHHKNIDNWRLDQSKKITKNLRPDLYRKYMKKNNLKKV